nr:PREDICTED: methionine aminopeptidase 1 [Haliaeetus albicilla]
MSRTERRVPVFSLQQGPSAPLVPSVGPSTGLPPGSSSPRRLVCAVEEIDCGALPVSCEHCQDVPKRPRYIKRSGYRVKNEDCDMLKLPHEHGRIIRGRNDNRKIEVNGSAEKAQRKAEFSPENSPESGPDGEKEWLSSMACQEVCRIEVQVSGTSWCTAACLELCCSSSDGAAVPLETEGKSQLKPAPFLPALRQKTGNGAAGYTSVTECFKGSWATHKLLHKKAKDEKAKREVSSWNLEGDVNTNPWSGYRYTGKLRPHYPLTPTRPVPSYIQRPDYADHPLGMSESEQALKGTSQIKILSSEDIDGMRVVCRLAREVLDVAAMMVKAGVTTEEIDHAVHLACIARNCYPSPLNYYNFPKSCCTSVNEVICHGIPDRRPLQEGDIVNVDITVYRNGYHGDLNETFYVGEVDEGARRLVQTTYECLMQAIDAVKPGVRYRELGNIIQKHAQANGFSVVRSYCGHGIHKLFHTAPNVPHYAKNKAVGVMKPGHVFTIEPMICEGGWQDETWPDGWTAVTRDGKRSAQFEHTLLVTDTGCEILTRRLDSIRPHFMTQ